MAHRGPREGQRIADVSNGEINRELQHLKRIFGLALQAEKVLRKPHIPLLEERNTRAGFFERETLGSVLAHLPAPLRPVITFAYITGWRITSEILPLEWRQVDFTAGEIRLDPETTKNRDGRVFPMTDHLRALLQAARRARAATESGSGRAVGVRADGGEGPRGHESAAADQGVYESVADRLCRRRLSGTHSA